MQLHQHLRKTNHQKNYKITEFNKKNLHNTKLKFLPHTHTKTIHSLEKEKKIIL